MKKFETDIFYMTVNDNALVEFKVKKDCVLKAKDVMQAQEMSKSCIPNTKFYVLMEAEGDFHLSSDTRQFGASKEYAEHAHALALCSDSMTHKVLGNVFIKFSRPHTPTKFFDDRQKAIEWLNTFRK